MLNFKLKLVLSNQRLLQRRQKVNKCIAHCQNKNKNKEFSMFKKLCNCLWLQGKKGNLNVTSLERFPVATHRKFIPEGGNNHWI